MSVFSQLKAIHQGTFQHVPADKHVRACFGGQMKRLVTLRAIMAGEQGQFTYSPKITDEGMIERELNYIKSLTPHLAGTPVNEAYAKVFLIAQCAEIKHAVDTILALGYDPEAVMLEFNKSLVNPSHQIDLEQFINVNKEEKANDQSN